MSVVLFPRPVRGFTLVELLVVVAIIAILSSMAVSQYVNYRTKAAVTSYALPILRACMSDIASECSSNTPSSPQNYGDPVDSQQFPNCKSAVSTPAGTVKMVSEEYPICENTGMLSQGKVYAYIDGSRGYRAVCRVSVRPFTCGVEAE